MNETQTSVRVVTKQGVEQARWTSPVVPRVGEFYDGAFGPMLITGVHYSMDPGQNTLHVMVVVV